MFKTLSSREERSTATGNTMLPGNYRAFLGGDRQIKCLPGHRQNTSWWLEDDQLRCLRNGRTKCAFTVSCRRPGKHGCRSNSLCFCAAHTSSYVSSEFCTFRCLVGEVCQRYCPLPQTAVRKHLEHLSSNDFPTPGLYYLKIHSLHHTTSLWNESWCSWWVT